MSEREARGAITEVVTDDAGRFEIAVPTALPLDLEVRAAGHASNQRPYVFAGEDLVLWLVAAASLEGTLTRATDSAPVENALIVGQDDRRVEVCRARGARRRLPLRGPPVRTDHAADHAWGRRRAAVSQGRGRGGHARGWIVLDPGVRIHGVVTDPNGRPIAGAEVGLGGSFKRSTTTDVEGVRDARGRRRAAPDLTDLRARAEGTGATREAALRRADRGHARGLRPPPGPGRTGRVLDPKGTPLEGVYVGASGTKKAEGVSKTDWVSTTTDAEAAHPRRSTSSITSSS